MKPHTLTALNGIAAARSARLLEWFKTTKLDALVLAGPENVHYATGYHSMPASNSRAHRMAVVIGPDGGMALVGPYSELPAAADSGLDPSTYIGYGTFYFTGESEHPVTTSARRAPTMLDAPDLALLRLARGARRVGVDENVTPASIDRIRVLGDAEVLDVSAGLHAVRAVKSPAEVECLRRAARLAEEGVEAALAQLQPGVTERELGSVVAATMSAGGAMPLFIVVAAGKRSAGADIFPTESAISPGGIIRFDVGCTYDGYSSDIGRTAILGEPTHEQRSVYHALLAGEEAQIELAAPGISASSLYKTAIAAVEGGGLHPDRRHHCGHGIGMNMYELFSVTEDATHVLEPGNVLCVETPYYDLEWGGMMVEDTLAVTESGVELLTVSDRGLRVVSV